MFSLKTLINLAIVGLLLVGCVEKKGKIEVLTNLNWQFLNPVDSSWYGAVVPGSVQEDLLTHKLIPDPYDGVNEDSILWVEESNWKYSATLPISEKLLTYNHLELVFKGLDTYAKVYVNDSLIIESNNMFIEYHADIRQLIKPGGNSVQVIFESPIEHNKEVLKTAPYQLPSSEIAEFKVASFVRKAAYQFGWDFAPRIVTMGIWQPVLIQAWDEVKLAGVQLIPKQISDSLALYEARITIESSVEKDFVIDINGALSEISLVKGKNSVTRTLTIEQPKMWWPNGMGEQYLYEIRTNLWDKESLIDADTSRLGVRAISLIQEEDSVGTSFRFMVNGKEMFIKGANWSPLSSYPSSIADSTYQNRLEKVQEAHMNMLRVWGGGFYESDLFYELCDEYGILIWQDFMFANTMYLPNEAFRENVKSEIEYQILRLQNHPSIALWNGNNEIEVAWSNWGWQDQYDYSEADSLALWNFYLEIFEDIIPSTLKELAPEANYTATSPLSNWGADENFNHGSMHYWGVWHGNDRFEDFNQNTGRFMAEYGFQSYPSIETLQGYYHLNEIHLDSNRLLHQKSYVGNQLILKETERYFGEASSSADFIENSQKTQAIALKMAIQAHRLANKCDGTLFWQLNDCWPGPSWSIFEANGAPKYAYGVVKDRYQSSIIIPKLATNNLEIFIISENDSIKNVNLTIELIRYDRERIWVLNKALKDLSRGRHLAYKSHKMKVLDGMKEEEVTLKISLKADGKLLDLEYLYFTSPGHYKGEFDLIGVN